MTHNPDEVPLSEPDQPEPETSPAPTDTEKSPRPRSRGRKVGLWVMASLVMLVGVLVLGLFLSTGRPITVPSWISNRAELLLARQLPHLDITLGKLGVVIEEGFHPRIRAQDLQLREENSSSVIRLADVNVALSFDSLISGQIAPTSIEIAEVFLSVRRLDDGSFNLTLGEGGQDGSRANMQASLANIGQVVGGILNRPGLAKLQEVRITGLNMRYEDVRAGQGWTIDGGQARLTRDREDVSFRANLVALGARAYVSAIEASMDLSLESSGVHFGLTFEDMPAREIATQTPALGWLEILNAPISGSLRASTNEAGELGPTAVALQIGQGALQPNDQVLPIPFEGANTYLTYDPKHQLLTLDQFSVTADLVSATAQGRVMLRRPDLGIPQELLGQLEFTKLEVNPRVLENSPIALDSAFADFRLRLDPFELSLGQLVLSQQGQRLRLSGHLRPDNRYWDYAIDGTMTQLKRDAVLGVWPVEAKPGLRKVIAERIHNVDIRDINVAVRSRGSQPPNVFADFQFHNLDMTVVPTLPPVQSARGVATFVENQFMVGAEAGYMEADVGGKLDIAGTGFLIKNTRVKQSPARVQLAAKGPITAALSILNRPPLKVMDKASLPVDFATGTVKALGEIDLILKPKLQPHEIVFAGNLEGTDVRTSHFLPGKEIAADLTGFVDSNHIRIDGVGTVGALPVQARWESPIGPATTGRSVLTGEAEISRLAVQEFDVGLPLETFSEKAPATFRIDLVKGKPPALTLRSDVVGLGLDYAPLGYRKAPEAAGVLEVDMTLSSPVSVDRFQFEAPEMAVLGSVALRPEGGLERVEFQSFEVGSWLSGTGALVGRGEGQVPAMVMSSGSFDVRGLPTGGGDGGSDAALGPIDAELQRVQITESYYLTDFRGQFVDQNGISGSFTGRFNGGATVQGEMSPNASGSEFLITSDRGGDVISEIGIAKTSGPGAMTLRLAQDPGAGNFQGQLSIRNVKVLDAPAFAEMLNTVSVVGLLDQLNGPGIPLTEIASEFRLTPTTLHIDQGSAVGPAMGISLDGTMNLSDSRMNFQGAFSPVYLLNAVGRVISKKGEGLIAFNYMLTGPPDDYSISVNPLSALTPGFLRGIFRTPDGTAPNPTPLNVDDGDGGQDSDLR
ncbi:AsmA-like C-terminal region-containing protein [uncultured Shimia sp.]|uniref:AsmA-like C-terminal region-containing protein n=1 Tax=uncultured Shimia sp. TaxID=573152 RepID=UPI002626F114|nr:AsmA-like C-terminal region-containing protein [uncultured Shimia sp.]